MVYNMRLFIIIFFVLLSQLYSETIPVKIVKLTSTFGESREDHFHNGVDLGAGEQDVFSIKEGKIIFYFDKSEFPNEQYPGSGNFIVIDHADKRSYYMHLKDTSINKTNYQINEGGYIGITSDTGHSYGIHLHFGIEKKRPLEILNPILFFRDQFEDTISPRIEQVLIRIDDSELKPIPGSTVIRNGSKIALFVNTYDLIQGNNNKMGPYKITCNVNNEKFREYVFDKLIVKNNYYYLPPNYTFKDIYYDKYILHLGEFAIQEKKYVIQVIVEDFAGNSTKIQKILIIR